MFVMNVMQDFKYILMLALELVLLVNYNTIIIKLKTPIKPLQVYENALHVIQIAKNVSLLQQTVLNVIILIFYIMLSAMSIALLTGIMRTQLQEYVIGKFI